MQPAEKYMARVKHVSSDLFRPRPASLGADDLQVCRDDLLYATPTSTVALKNVYCMALKTDFPRLLRWLLSAVEV